MCWQEWDWCFRRPGIYSNKPATIHLIKEAFALTDPNVGKLYRSRYSGYAKYSAVPCGTHRCKSWLVIPLDIASRHLSIPFA